MEHCCVFRNKQFLLSVYWLIFKPKVPKTTLYFEPKVPKTILYLDSKIPKTTLYFEGEGEGEDEVAFCSAKRWDRRNRANLIESATPCHEAQVVGPYWDSNPLRLTILAAMSEDYTTVPQHLQIPS